MTTFSQMSLPILIITRRAYLLRLIDLCQAMSKTDESSTWEKIYKEILFQSELLHQVDVQIITLKDENS